MAVTKPSWIGASSYAAFTALATLGLIAMGGLVTSHGAGMAVPDWPTTYGYNMFLFPISQWVGGIFYEHTHRLWASGVGFLTIGLAFLFQWKATDRRLARWAWLALGLVIVQGVLGGLRVSLMKDQIGVVHASLAQAFLVLLVCLAVLSSARWARYRMDPVRFSPGTARWVAWVTVAIFAQLVIGATMRHQHAGLAVPDFPLAYGQIWPPTDEAFLQRANALRIDSRDFSPITAFQVHLHMTHRIMAVGILTAVVTLAWRIRRLAGTGSVPSRLAGVWVGLILVQALLGALTVWTNKAADIATAHVVVGAAVLSVGAVLTAVGRVGVRAVGVVETGCREGRGSVGLGTSSMNEALVARAGSVSVSGVEVQG